MSEEAKNTEPIPFVFDEEERKEIGEHGGYSCAVCGLNYIGSTAYESALECAESDIEREKGWGIPTYKKEDLQD